MRAAKKFWRRAGCPEANSSGGSTVRATCRGECDAGARDQPGKNKTRAGGWGRDVSRIRRMRSHRDGTRSGNIATAALAVETTRWPLSAAGPSGDAVPVNRVARRAARGHHHRCLRPLRPRDEVTDVGDGTTAGSLALGGRRVEVQRPRVRHNGREVPLTTWEGLGDDDPLNRRAVEQMLIGVSTRKYRRSLEDVPADVVERGISKSAVSRRFVAATGKQLRRG